MKKYLVIFAIMIFRTIAFSQDNSSVRFVWDTNDISTFDTLGYEGEEVMLQTELMLVDEINGEDTVYAQVKNLEEYVITITAKEKRVSYINKPKHQFTVFHFRYNYTYEIVYSVKGYYSKKVILNTHNGGTNLYGYLFPCEVRLYKQNSKNKKYKQKLIPYISYDATSDFYQYTLIKK